MDGGSQDKQNAGSSLKRTAFIHVKGCAPDQDDKQDRKMRENAPHPSAKQGTP